MELNKVFVVQALRTPIGSFLGSLSAFSAPDLASLVIKEMLQKTNLPSDAIGELFMGNVLSAGIGQAPARQAALLAGLATSVECTGINKVCASGSKSIALAAQAIQLGIHDVVLAGGMESMSNVPHYLEKSRAGYKLGHQQITDGIIKDGLWDVYNDFHMGSAAELTAKEMNISREMQDAFAVESYKRSLEAQKNNKFKKEIVSISIPNKSGSPTIIDSDEEPTKVNFDKIPGLKPVFDKQGTVTAANASSLNDGAAVLMLCSEKALKKYGLKAIAQIRASADFAQDPKWFTTAPAYAIPNAIKNAGLQMNDVDVFEINEAFAVVSLANEKLLNLSPDKVNLWGGAVSLGHPIGCSGARIAVTLLSVLEDKNKTIGVTGICNGGGGATALVFEKI